MKGVSHMLMGQISICLILLGIVGFSLARMTSTYRVHKPKHAAHEAPAASEQDSVDERWWREVFDYWEGYDDPER